MVILKTYDPCGQIQARSVLNELKTKYPSMAPDVVVKTESLYPPLYEAITTIDYVESVKAFGVGPSKSAAREESAVRAISMLLSITQEWIDMIDAVPVPTKPDNDPPYNYNLTYTYVVGQEGMLNMDCYRICHIKSTNINAYTAEQIRTLMIEDYTLDRDWVRILADYLLTQGKMLRVFEKKVMFCGHSHFINQMAIIDLSYNGESDSYDVNVRGYNQTTLMRHNAFSILTERVVGDSLELASRKTCSNQEDIN